MSPSSRSMFVDPSYVYNTEDPPHFNTEDPPVGNTWSQLPDPISTISFTLSLVTIILMFLLFLCLLWSLISLRRILLLLWSHLSFLHANPLPPLWLFLRRTLPAVSFAGSWSRILFTKKVQTFFLLFTNIIKSWQSLHKHNKVLTKSS